MLRGGLCLRRPAVGGHASGVCDQGVCPARHSLVYVFVSSRGQEAEEGREVPLSWLWPLTAGGTPGGSWRSLWILSGSALKISRRGLVERLPTTP